MSQVFSRKCSPFKRNSMKIMKLRSFSHLHAILQVFLRERPMSESLRPVPVSRRPSDAGDRLDSWKEIAAYLGREVRTVQGWEKSEALPIHRHQHARQGSVYAFKSELDAWRDARKESPDPSVVPRHVPLA